jgi:tRNA(fMet)-specific endonuclease VapC
VLDTTALSALMRAEPAAIERLRDVAKPDVLLPQPVIAEVLYSIERLRSSRKRTLLEERFALFRAELVRAPWTDAVSDHFGAIKAALERAGARLDDFDIAIAAHARALDATLVTANVRHLGRVPGLRVEDWTG